MTEEEKKEFTELKRIRADRGFWIPIEKERWDYLFQLHALDFKLKCKKIDLVFKQMIEN